MWAFGKRSDPKFFQNRASLPTGEQGERGPLLAFTPHVINHDRIEEQVRAAVSNRSDVTVERMPHMFVVEHGAESSRYTIGTAVVVKWASPQPLEVVRGVQLLVANHPQQRSRFSRRGRWVEQAAAPSGM